MNTVPVTMDVPKEAKDAVDFVVKLLQDIFAKKSIADILAGNLPPLMTVVGEYAAIPEEIKSQAHDQLMAYILLTALQALGK